MHQQIRSRVVFHASMGDEPAPGSLGALLTAIRDAGLSLCIAGFSPIEPNTFVMAVDHHEQPDDDSTTETLRQLVIDHGFGEPTVVQSPTWSWLPNEKGALLAALGDLGALDAEEVILGATADNRTLVHTRHRDEKTAS